MTKKQTVPEWVTRSHTPKLDKILYLLVKSSDTKERKQKLELIFN